MVGAALSGTAAARLLSRLGYEVTVHDQNPAAVEALAGSGYRLDGGAWQPMLLDDVELTVVSPGVPEHADPIQDALGRGLPVWSEIELAARHLDVPMAAVTGTNGKTTVTSVAAQMLADSGLRTAAVGNIGSPLCDAVGLQWDALVVEASSFQLRFTHDFRANVAVILNVAPDHLDWHGSFEAYADAKAMIFRNHTASDVVIYDIEDHWASELVSRAPSRRIPISGRKRSAGGGPEGGKLWIGDASVDLTLLSETDPAFLVDLVAAGVAGLELGAAPEAVAEVVAGFRPGPHRRRRVGSWAGVSWINDSKATNPHAAVASAAAYGSVVLIAGGRNKGLDIVPLAKAPTLRHLVAIGESGPELVGAAGRDRATLAADMEEAVAIADEIARPGDVVLLAPGCASFDMFASYEERGVAFTTAVLRRKEPT
ncbi:MAG: UDP-N-acetylmuramoyl-L-alanine--D-glutamate ligase [Acidimicrobiia bacterium]